MPDNNGVSASARTVLVAGAANVGVGIAKAVAGLISGSAAMLAEAAHSVADTASQLLLFTALRRSDRPPHGRHPFGHGKERYVWSLLAAAFTFVVGAGFSIAHGVVTISGGAYTGDYLASYIVLVVAFGLEGGALVRSLRQVRGEARRSRTPPRRFLRLTADTTVRAVVMEDSAALVGLVIAALGLGLSQLTGRVLWDGLASVAIGLLLLVIATVLARNNMSLLVGRAVPDRVHTAIHDELAALPTVHRVDTLLTMQLGPDDILVAAKLDFRDEASAAEIEAAAAEAERRLCARHPGIRHVFLDPTRSAAPPRSGDAQ
ncbi:cation diffusion facilitator family transporter [Micromonospora pattaloongensis]|uniref:Cation diffusion facilitator family transporter n=1 Tax=Micromonospora pattaloongensis TaxID=405436 RepID=A0A1H3P8J3_9ACTN|nr:cation diffusion facilitator family transporter [Micromonospora pattaloongensis]SDY97253.1 cation diffusion facilitator family transporter [Micromonospora pattaloongensis]